MIIYVVDKDTIECKFDYIYAWKIDMVKSMKRQLFMYLLYTY